MLTRWMIWLDFLFVRKCSWLRLIWIIYSMSVCSNILSILILVFNSKAESICGEASEIRRGGPLHLRSSDDDACDCVAGTLISTSEHPALGSHAAPAQSDRLVPGLSDHVVHPPAPTQTTSNQSTVRVDVLRRIGSPLSFSNLCQ